MERFRVDHELRQVIDLLPDREAETLAQWLKDHPGVEYVTRDRSRAYGEGITSGAPDAVQIADRWHLIQNLCKALELLLTRHYGSIRNAANPIAALHDLPADEPTSILEAASEKLGTVSQPKLRAVVAANRTKRLAQYQEMVELKE